ncbi:MAG: DoxX family protein [Acidobacteriota bacterium]
MPASHQPTSRWRSVVGTLAGAVLGVVFLVAVWGKGLDPSAFADQIRLEGLDFLFPALTVALIALALEAGLGTALVLGVRRLWVLLPTVALVLFFIFLTGRNYWLTARGLRDPSEACGCFGNLVERTPGEAFWQDLLLLGIPALLMFLGRGRGGGIAPLRAVVAGLVAVASILFAWKAPELPLDNLATRLKPGVEVADLCAGRGAETVCLQDVVPELLEGHHWVMLANPDTTAVADSIESLNEHALAALDGAAPPLWMVSGALAEELQQFYWQLGPVFEVREAPEALLKPLFRTLPRSFEVVDGRVESTVSGLPPAVVMTAATAGNGLAVASLGDPSADSDETTNDEVQGHDAP